MVGSSGSSEDKISSLDLRNPLHLRNSYFNSATIISVKLTGTENYRVWTAAMKLVISTRNKTGFLDETYDKLDGSIILSLLQKIHNFKQDELTPIRSSLLSRETISDVKEAFAIISRESHRGIASSFGSVPKPQISNFVSRIKFSNNNNNGNKRFDNKWVNNSGNNTFNTNSNNRGPNLNLTCKNCGKVGHTIERCFDIIGYPPGYNRNSSTPGVKSTCTANAEVNQTNQTSTQSSPSLSLSNE
ncbi:ribonuclease H-like domain-containing protein [Tanacetum coccineum]